MADQSRDLVQRGNHDGSSPASKGKNYLFAIAINDYKFCSKLNNAVYDVEAFINLMCKRFEFENENILFIKDRDASKRRIENEFLSLIRKVTPQDNLVVYFSGHGRYDEQFGGNWVPVEAGTGDDDWPDYLSNDQVRSYLGKIRSKHTFLIADSCFSGSLFMDKNKEKITGDRLDTVPSRWGLTSGKKEIVSDGNPGQHSPFAQALLDVYARADHPLSTTMVCAMVMEIVIANAQQTPMGSPLTIDGHKGGQMVFYLRENEDQVWQILKDTPDGCMSYLQRFPEGKYKSLAEEMVFHDQQNKAWDLAKSAKTKSALYRFEREYPDSEMVRSRAVDRALEVLDEEESWEDAKNADKVSAYRKYLRTSSLKKYEQAASEAIHKILKQEELEVWQSAKQDNTTVAYQKYLREFPFGEFVEEAQTALASIDFQNKHKNPPSTFEYDFSNDLSDKIDLDNPEYKLNNFQSTGKNGVMIEIWVNDIQKYQNFKLRKKDHIRIRYSKDNYENLETQGNISSRQITPYLKTDANNLIKLELDIVLRKKVRKIRFEPRDSKHNFVPGVKIICTKSNSNIRKYAQNAEIKFEGEELKETWVVEAEKRNFIAKDISIIPKSSADMVYLTLVPHLKVRFEVTHGSKPFYGYTIQIPGKNIKQGATQVEFIGDEIDKTYKVTISHRERDFEERTFNFCPAKDGEIIQVSLYKKQTQGPPPPEVELVVYKVNAGKHGVLTEKDLTSYYNDGSDVKRRVIADKNYKFKKFMLQGDTLVAQYRKTNTLLKNPTFYALIAFILAFFIMLVWVIIPKLVNGENKTSGILQYIQGIELKQAKLEELKKNHCGPNPEIKEKPISLWELIFSFDSKRKTLIDNCQKLEDALAIRTAINYGRFDELQNKIYFDDQKLFENAINSIDGEFRTKISDLMFKHKDNVSEMDLNQIADFINNYQELLKIREEVKATTSIMGLEIITSAVNEVDFPIDSVKVNIKEEIKMRKNNLASTSTQVKLSRALIEARWEIEFWSLVRKDGPVELAPFKDLFTNYRWSSENECKRFYEKYLKNEMNFKKFQAIDEIERRSTHSLAQLRYLIEKN